MLKPSFWILAIAWAASPTDFVDVKKHDFSMKMSEPCYLRAEVAEALTRVQNELHVRGYGLKLMHCYQPPSKATDPIMSKGGAVATTVVDSMRQDIPVPPQIARQASKNPCEVAKKRSQARLNCEAIVKTMAKEGFSPIKGAWWEFEFKKNSEYPIDQRSFEDLAKELSQ